MVSVWWFWDCGYLVAVMLGFYATLLFCVSGGCVRVTVQICFEKFSFGLIGLQNGFFLSKHLDDGQDTTLGKRETGLYVPLEGPMSFSYW